MGHPPREERKIAGFLSRKEMGKKVFKTFFEGEKKVFLLLF